MAFIPIKFLGRIRTQIPGMSSTRLYHCLRTVREDGPYQSLVLLKFLDCEMCSKECVHNSVTDFDILMTQLRRMGSGKDVLVSFACYIE